MENNGKWKGWKQRALTLKNLAMGENRLEQVNVPASSPLRKMNSHHIQDNFYDICGGQHM
ncbi:hypothetical protein WMC59_06245 [Staphylococcus delphini]|uniref:hypothetical protein n=1 Tax=Staphylococcus delphini TaxID=53344 RepID=UPI00374F519C